PVAERLLELTEEVRTVARKLLHFLGKRHVQPLAEVCDPGLALLVLGLRGVERFLQGGKLKPERRELLVKHLDFGERVVGDLLLRIELGAERSGAVLGALRLAAGLAEQPGEVLVLLVLLAKRRLERGELVLGRFLLRALERKKFGELRELPVQSRQ